MWPYFVCLFVFLERGLKKQNTFTLEKFQILQKGEGSA